jgi:hypothetical protein
VPLIVKPFDIADVLAAVEAAAQRLGQASRVHPET